VQFSDDEAHRRTEEFISGECQEEPVTLPGPLLAEEARV
jgi:hypothetical protein